MQYSRRDTVTVVGLAKPDAESQADLCTKVAAVLTQSGETVSVTDLSAVHRNSKDGRNIRGKVVPPSVTVRFCTVNKKDNILKRYSNYDSAKKAARDVRVYQSLSRHYSDLRSTIVEFCNGNESEVLQKFGMRNCGVGLKWCTYQSPTAGFAIKLKDDTYFNKVHGWHDFARIFQSKFPESRLG